jgi:hypothetical protein
MWGFHMGRIEKPRHIFLAGFGKFCISGLDQTEFTRPFDSRPTAINIKFAIYAFGMSPNRAQSNDKLLSDLGTRQLGFEQAQDVQLTLTERLDQGL